MTEFGVLFEMWSYHVILKQTFVIENVRSGSKVFHVHIP